MKRFYMLILLFIVGACSVKRHENQPINETDCTDALFTVVRFNSVLNAKAYNDSLFYSLIDSSRFYSDIFLMGEVQADDLHRKYNSHQSNKFNNAIIYSELKYKCIYSKDTLIVHLSTEREAIDYEEHDLILEFLQNNPRRQDSTYLEFYYLYEYKLIKQDNSWRIFYYVEELR